MQEARGINRAGRTSTLAGDSSRLPPWPSRCSARVAAAAPSPRGSRSTTAIGGMGELGQRRVVPADQSEVPAHRQAAAIDRPQAPDEQRQAAGEKSGGRHGAIENPQDLGLGGIGIMLGRDRQGSILQPLGAKLIPEPGQPLPSRAAHQGTRQRRDLAMPEPDQMGDRPAHSAAVIGADDIHRQRRAQLAFQRNDGSIEFGKRGQEPGIILPRGRDQNRIDAPAVEMADIGRIRGRVMVGAHDQQSIAGRPQDEFRPGDDLRGEGIGEIRGDKADQIGGPAPQALGNGIRLVAQLRGRAQDTQAQGRHHLAPAGEDLGDGRDRHPRALRHIADSDPSGGGAAQGFAAHSTPFAAGPGIGSRPVDTAEAHP